MNVLVDEPRLFLVGGPAPDLRAALAEDVRAGLGATPKRLSCRFFYDETGSRLFEEICAQPEYYLTRVETSLLESMAGQLVDAFDTRPDVVELGSGSAVKTRILLAAFLEAHGALTWCPIDISRHALTQSARGLLADFRGLEVRGIAAEYLDALATLGTDERRPRLVLWLGSSIGNFHRGDAAQFLAHVRASLGPEDLLLVGVDLRKDRRVLEAAYDDAAGVTARFNKNLLVRVNAELGGTFDLDAFRHRARYDEEAGRIEMYLDSLREQEVRIARLGWTVGFAAGEAVHTENSYKYSQAELVELAARAGLRRERAWTDAGGRFALQLLRA